MGIESDPEPFSGGGIPEQARIGVGREIFAQRGRTIHTLGRGTGALSFEQSQSGKATSGKAAN
jgi:hypothetical protein